MSPSLPLLPARPRPQSPPKLIRQRPMSPSQPLLPARLRPQNPRRLIPHRPMNPSPQRYILRPRMSLSRQRHTPMSPSQTRPRHPKPSHPVMITPSLRSQNQLTPAPQPLSLHPRQLECPQHPPVETRMSPSPRPPLKPTQALSLQSLLVETLVRRSLSPDPRLLPLPALPPTLRSSRAPRP
ncbi:hypothetical protein BDW74DRAFT_152762 [Aspergillus multicolor]|uniref:uncharacterized protein n=1 Tax=Aspergillus multicolor TaxID=41759 RepID=UPI003CCCEA78